MKPNKLESTFSSAKHVVVKSQGRDTFSVVNVSTGTTLVCKILKAGAISEVVTDSSDSTHVVDPQANAMERGESQTKNSDACKESDSSDNQATQNNSDVRTRRQVYERLGQLCLFFNLSDCVFD